MNNETNEIKAPFYFQNARKLLENQGRDSLRNAKERAKRFGEESAKMSQIARDARILADRQLEDANEITSIAQQAFKISNEAYEMASDAVQQQSSTGKQIRILQEAVGNLGKKLITVQRLSGKSLKDSTEAYNNALQIYQQALGLEVPAVESNDMENQAKKIEQEAVKLREEARIINEDNMELLRETQDRRIQLEDLLNRAKDQQRQVDAQLTDMKSNREKALNAVAAGNQVLTDAVNTLKTLEDFENSVYKNREAAREALNKIDDIDGIVRKALEKAMEAKDAMQGAGTAADLALSVARDAEAISAEASTAAANVSNEASQSKELAEELAAAAESLTMKIQDTKIILNEREELAADDGRDALTALEMANKALHDAGESTRKIQEAQNELEEIAAILESIEEPGNYVNSLKFTLIILQILI